MMSRRSAARAALILLALTGSRACADPGCSLEERDHALLSTRVSLQRARQLPAEGGRRQALLELDGATGSIGAMESNVREQVGRLVKASEAGRAVPPEVAEAFGIIRTHVGELRLGLLTEHAADQNSSQRLLDLAVGCFDAIGADEAEALRLDHADCRVQQAGFSADREAKCTSHDDIRKAMPHVPCSLGDLSGETLESIEDYERCLQSFYEQTFEVQALWHAYKDCKAATAALANHTLVCDSKQEHFEAGFCEFADACDCRHHHVGAWEEQRAQFELSAASRKASYRAALRIDCLFGVLEANETLRNESLQSCEGMSINTSVLSGDFGTLPTVDEVCASVLKKPCDDEWLAQEYTAKSWYEMAPVASCTACRATSTATTTEAAPSAVAHLYGSITHQFCYLSESGKMACWGKSPYPALQAVDFGEGRKVTQVAPADYFNCVALDDGAIKCSDPRMDPTFDADRKAVKVAGGRNHRCAILDDASLRCWGDGKYGKLGQGGTQSIAPDSPPAVDLGGHEAVDVSLGAHHTCVLCEDGQLRCFGWGDNGRLGSESQENIGDAPSEMGANLKAVDLGAGRKVAKFDAGGDHTCAILDNAELKCWGYVFQLGHGDGISWGSSAGHMGDNLKAVDLGSGRSAAAVSCGYRLSCAILDNGDTKCWGDLAWAQGQGRTEPPAGRFPDTMGDNLPAVDLGTGRRAVEVAAGRQAACALLDDGSVKCWGSNQDCEIADCDLGTLGDEPGEMGDALPTVALPALA